MVTQTYNVNIDSKNYARKEKGMKEETTLSNVHRYIREYNETTGIQGLHYLTDKRSVTEKIVWGIILLISLSGCVFMIFEILQKYQNSPIVIGLANEPGFIHQIPFPAITICSTKKMSGINSVFRNMKNKRNQNLTDEERRMVDFKNFLCYENFVYRSIKKMSNDTSNYEGILNFIKENTPPRELLRFSLCFFMDEFFICTDKFTQVLTRDGICYSFNVMDRSEVFKKQVFHYENFHHVDRNSSAFDGESGYIGNNDIDIYPKRALIPGIDKGFIIELRYSYSTHDEFCDQNKPGYKIGLHHPAETYDTVRENTYVLPLNKSMMLSITPELIRTSEKIKNYNVKKRKCYLKGERQLKYFQIYTQSNCNLECLTNATLSRCGCVDFYMPRINGTEFICSLERKACIERAEIHLYKVLIKSNEANSGITKYNFACNCLPLCTELKYNLEMTQTDIQKNKEAFFNTIDAVIVKTLLRSQDNPTSQLSINFKSSSFSILERNELYGITDLISNFGGLLGLFTGFSFISLAEIIYFLTLRIWCNRRMYGQWTGPPV